MMIIDAHQHVCWYDRNEAGLVADLDAQGIDAAWLLTWEIPPDEDSPIFHRHFNPLHARPDGTHVGIPLVDALGARERYPDRFVVGYCPLPRVPDAPALLESAYHMHGARICGEWKFRMLVDDPRCLELFRKAGELGCPVVVHLDVPYLADAESGEMVYQREWYGGTVENLARAAAACRDTAFIGHGPGFWREISGDAATAPGIYPTGSVTSGGRVQQLFEQHDNVSADLSAGSGLGALNRDTEHAVEFLCRFADRLLFGRDTCGGDLREFFESLDLPDDVRQKIYAGNAQRLVAMGTPPE